MYEKIKQLTEKNGEYLLQMRRHFHQHPEASYKEYETTKTIKEEAEKLGLTPHLFKETGLYVDLKGGKPGKMVALRADIDALEVSEKTDLPFASKNEGIMHACGHDAHTAMLLTAMKTLHEIKDELEGTVRFIFQPAEEGPGGARLIIKEGVLEGVDNIFGEHIWMEGPTGTISAEPGPRFAATDVIYVTFKGKSGHGAQPQQTIDATVMAASFVMNVQTLVSRGTDPQHAAVCTVGKLVSGTRFNVISGEAKLDATIRTFYDEDRDRMEAAIKRFAEDTAHMYGGTAEVEYIRGTDIVKNEQSSSDRVKRLTKQSFGEEAYAIIPPTTGGEDFGAFSDLVPGAFAVVGCANPAKGSSYPHHNDRFNPDEDALQYGAELYALYAYDYLNNEQGE